ncbi:MAG: FAD-binding oxidoreductase [Actinomycetota bacterium]
MPETTMAGLSGGEVGVEDSAIAEFADRLDGQLLRPGEDDYERARKVWNGMIDKRPVLIVRCGVVDDVVGTIRFAREHDVLTSVRGGGHNIAGMAVCDGGIMIDLSPMREVEVDPEVRTARVGGGALLGDLDRATQAFGLATTTGVVPHTGVGGLTLGGGAGRLARKHGLACDNLLGVELVTASGEVVKAGPDENEDLFWGVRGGGGNFGVVTSFQFRLHPVGPQVLGGPVIHPFESAGPALRFYADFSLAAPDQVSADAALVTLPDGERAFAVSVCYTGDPQDGERVLEPLRRFGSPIADQIGLVAYTDLQAPAEDPLPYGPNYYWKSHLFTELGDDAIETTIDSFVRAPSPRSAIGFQQYGGATGRIGPTETAFFHREGQYDGTPLAIWTDPAETDAHRQWVREWWDASTPFAMGGEYVNNLGDDAADRVRASYGENYERLVDLKNTYDPTNFFRLNANITPTV